MPFEPSPGASVTTSDPVWDYDGRTPKAPTPSTLVPVISDAGSGSTEFLPVWVDRNGVLWGKRNGSWLVKAADETTNPVTWSSNVSGYHNFPHGIDSIRDLDDGEYLVGVRGTVQANPGGPGTIDYPKLYKSNGANYGAGIATATWSVVLQSGHGYNNFLQRCIDVHGKIVVVCSYGPTVTTRALAMNPDGPPKEVWLSTDYGVTFAQVFDLWNQNVARLGGGTNVTNDHTHGITFDPRHSRIWLTNGDTNDGIWYSDNLGKSWNFVVAEQPTALQATRRGVLFTSDHSPNGLYRIPEFSPNEEPAKKFVKPAYAIDASGNSTVIGIMAFKSALATYFAFSVSSQVTDGSRILATADGENFYELWHDATTYTNNGFEQLVGPTAAGYLHGYLDPDSRFTPDKTYFKALAPSWIAKDAIGAAAPNEIMMLNGSSATVSWAAMPTALTEILGTTRLRRRIDLTNAGSVRLVTLHTTLATASSGATLALQYSTDGGATWLYADGSDGTIQAPSGAFIAIDSGNGGVPKVSAWIPLPVSAKADLMWRIVGQSTTSPGSPAFGYVAMQAKV